MFQNFATNYYIKLISISHFFCTTETSPFSKCTYPVISVNQCGANTEDTYEGHSFVCNEQGQRIIQLPYFESTLSYFETEKESMRVQGEELREIQEIILRDGVYCLLSTTNKEIVAWYPLC